MGITLKKKRKSYARGLYPNPSHKLSYNHSHNHSHLKSSLHYRHQRHHHNTPFKKTKQNKKRFFPPTFFKPNITPLKSNFTPTGTIISTLFSLTLPSLSSLLPPRLFSRSHSVSRQPKTPSNSSKTRHKAKSASTEDR